MSIYDISQDDAADAEPKAAFVSEMDGQFTKVWKLVIPSQGVWRVTYTGKGGGLLDIRGIDDRRRWWWISMSKEELEKKSMTALLRIASAWYDQMKAGEIPSISLPTRTKYNIEYDDASEVWKYGDKESMRTAASGKSATHLLKMAYVIGFIKQQLKENRSSTLRRCIISPRDGNGQSSVRRRRAISLSPYFQTSLASSNSMLYFVRVGSEMDGISPPFIWSYQALAIRSSADNDFFSSSSLDIEIHHHLLCILYATDIEDAPTLPRVRDSQTSLGGMVAFQTFVNCPSISLTKSAFGTASAALS